MSAKMFDLMGWIANERRKEQEGLMEQERIVAQHVHQEAERDVAIRNRPLASASDYARWLRGYLLRGLSPTHCYGYDFPGGILVDRPLVLPLLYGASALLLIVKQGASVSFGQGQGHTTVFFMDEFRPEPSWFVPVYRDVAKLLG